MIHWCRLLGVVSFAAFASVQVAEAQTTIKPAIVYSTGGKFDKSFNEGVSQGGEKFKTETKAGRRVRARQRDPVRAGAAAVCPARAGSDCRRRLRGGCRPR